MQTLNLGSSDQKGRLFRSVAEAIAAGQIVDQLQRARLNVELFGFGAGALISLLPFLSIFHHGTLLDAKKGVV